MAAKINAEPGIIIAVNGKNKISGAKIKSTTPTMIVPKQSPSHTICKIAPKITRAAPAKR